jgi:hypothetical protein
MRRNLSVVVLMAAATATLGVGSGITAWASWSTTSNSAPVTARAAEIPVLDPPRVKASGAAPEIVWSDVAGDLADHYVVTRRSGTNRTVVCTVAAGVTGCVDGGVAAGSTVTYVIHATLGPRWAGRDSAPSDPVGIPAATLVSSAAKTAPAVKTPRSTPAAEAAPAPEPQRIPARVKTSPSPAAAVESAPSADSATTEPAPAEPDAGAAADPEQE